MQESLEVFEKSHATAKVIEVGSDFGPVYETPIIV